MTDVLNQNTYNCKTIVRKFKNIDGKVQKVKLRYAVWCAITQERIYVGAFITRTTDGVTHDNHKRCDKTHECVVTVILYNKPGSQKYNAVGLDCFEQTPDCATLATHKSGKHTDSADMLPCDAPCLGGLVVRSKYF